MSPKIIKLTKLPLSLSISLQIANTVAPIRLDLWPTGRSELRGNGVLHHHSVHDAPVRCPIDRLLQLAHEQGARPHHVPVVLCLCRRLAHVRVRRPRVSLLNTHQCIS